MATTTKLTTPRRRSVALPAPRSHRPKTPLATLAPHVSRTSRRLTKKQTIITSGLAILLVAGVLTGVILSHTSTKSNPPSDAAGALEYQAVLPAGKDISQLGGWKRLSPPGGETVVAYNDAIDGIEVSVTQQALPSSFQNNADEQVAELAKKFNATDKLTAGNAILYVGTSTKGPQSVILTKNNLLITIKSQAKIADASWIKYVTSLH